MLTYIDLFPTLCTDLCFFLLFFVFINQINVASVPHGFKEAMERIKAIQYQNTQSREMDAKIPAMKQGTGREHEHTAYRLEIMLCLFLGGGVK